MKMVTLVPARASLTMGGDPLDTHRAMRRGILALERANLAMEEVSLTTAKVILATGRAILAMERVTLDMGRLILDMERVTPEVNLHMVQAMELEAMELEAMAATLLLPMAIRGTALRLGMDMGPHQAMGPHLAMDLHLATEHLHLAMATPLLVTVTLATATLAMMQEREVLPTTCMAIRRVATQVMIHTAKVVHPHLIHMAEVVAQAETCRTQADGGVVLVHRHLFQGRLRKLCRVRH
mmetsp:Transcript_51239/g.93757  ORF Transcript_51239/g.93757 Transcript_51239/m.93757 type:complete len:238 (+) Transcript_51239:138-851(+)